MNAQHIPSDYFKKFLKKTTVCSFFLKIISIPIGIISAKLISMLVSHATNGEINQVINVGVILIIFILASKILQIFANIQYQKLQLNSLQKCKISLYKKFLSNPLHLLYSSEHGKSIEKLHDDFNTVTDKIINLYPDLYTGILTACAYTLFLAFNSIHAALILLAISFIQFVPPIIIKKYMQVNYDNCREIEAEITDFIIEACRGFNTIKLYNLKQWWLDKMSKYYKKYVKIGSTSIYTATAQHSINEFVSTILKYGTYGILGLLVLSKITDIDSAIQAIALSGGLYGAVKTVFDSIARFAVAKTAENRMFDWFSSSQNINCDNSFKNNKITLSHVNHSFSDKIILNDANIEIPSDKICIFKGDNGIGKSTLFKFITGLISCKDGNISVAGTNPLNFSDDIFPKKLFYLPQDDALFNFSPSDLYNMIEENSIENIINIAEKFGLTEKQIYDTNIDELSGGERKKVYLSLAFALNPEILLLDEPTNSLDDDSRKILIEFIKSRKLGTLVITHDSILDSCANIIYRIKNGGITVEK